MYKPSRTEFKALAAKYDVIPVQREIIADVETPVSAFLKIDEGGNAFLLESAERGERSGRYSFLGAGASTVVKAKGNSVEIERDGSVERFQSDDPIREVEEFLAKRPAPHDAAGFHGGAVGFIGYDSVRLFERLPDMPPDDLDLPDFALMIADTLLVFDHLKHRIGIVSNARVDGDPTAAYDRAVAEIERVARKLDAAIAVPTLSPAPPAAAAPMRGSVSREEFERMVERAKAYITDGDIFQVVLSQRFSVRLRTEPFNVYRILRTINPSPYMAFIKIGDLALAGASPEPLVAVSGRRVVTRPIAGTRPRGVDSAEDEALATELLADAKERAEHVMLVDLGRNDLGRVCSPGSVVIDEMMAIERYSHVMHIVSTVSGELAEGRDAIDALRAAFPAGTVSGAPKVRAMEIIDELEPVARGPYAGVYGYLGHSGDLDCGITIRTVVMTKGMAHVQAGAGIVADSVPSREYDECVNKAGALFAAVAGANAAVSD